MNPPDTSIPKDNSSPSAKPHRGLWYAFWTFIGVLTLILSCVHWLNWSGARALQQAIKRYEAQGETLDLMTLLSPLVDDEDNFCATPALHGVTLYEESPAGEEAERRRQRLLALDISKRIPFSDQPRNRQGAVTGQGLDPVAWLQALTPHTPPETYVDDPSQAARLVLDSLPNDPELLNELGARVHLPYAIWTPALRERELSTKAAHQLVVAHGRPLDLAMQNWLLRAKLAVFAQDSDEAHRCTAICLRSTEARSQEPLFLVVSLCVALDSLKHLDAIWEICRMRVGVEDDFLHLEQHLRRLPWDTLLLQAYRTEAVFFKQTMQWMKNNRYNKEIFEFWQNGFSNGGPKYLSLAPPGVYDYAVADGMDTYWQALIAPELGAKPRLSEEELQQVTLTLKQQWWKGTPMTAFYIYTDTLIRRQVTHAHTRMTLATAACALERYYLTHGSYPESLDALASDPLPHDPLTGSPPLYQRTPDGRYRLWSPGLDGVDDAGVRALVGDMDRPHKDEYRGDWVWDYPAEPQER